KPAKALINRFSSDPSILNLPLGEPIPAGGLPPGAVLPPASYPAPSGPPTPYIEAPAPPVPTMPQPTPPAPIEEPKPGKKGKKNRYSDDPNVRMQKLLYQSEDIGPIRREWRLFWFNDQPNHLTPERIHGNILP